VTRAQVRAELVQLEKAGWRPAMNMGNSPDYPAGIKAAEAKVAAQNEVTGSYGGVAGGVSASGAPKATRSEATGNTNLIYFGH
jgi:formylmethanofuran:tetrahydromethanopterin formyltransferase